MTEDKTSTNDQEEVETSKETTEEKTSKEKSQKADKLAEAKAQKEHWKKKALAAKEANKSEPKEKETPTNDFSPKDYLALSQAKVHADDLDEVTDYAKYKGITVTEALKTSYIQTTLKEKAEERATADATNTGGGRRKTTKITGKELLKSLNKGGELPKMEDEDFGKVAEARLQDKLKSK